MGSDPRGLPRCIHQAGKKELRKGRDRTPCLKIGACAWPAGGWGAANDSTSNSVQGADSMQGSEYSQDPALHSKL